MDFNDLVQEVYNLTNRPDRTAETQAAVKAATLKAHRTDFYSKDLSYSEVDFLSVSYNHQLSYETEFSRFRNFKAVTILEASGDTEGTTISIVTPDELLDSYGRYRTNIAYIAGTVMQIKSSIEFQYANVGVYKLPSVLESSWDSWISRLFPYAIIYEAARVMFKAIGKAEESNSMRDLVAEEYQLLKAAAVTDIGY